MNNLALLCLVVGISDGDTLTARCGQPGAYEQVKVRISAIDAPEKRQPYGNRAKQALSDLCYMQQASIRQTSHDRYKRIVADVECQGRDAGQHMVSAGMAWVFDRYASKHQHLYAYQQQAQAARRGLWQDAHTVPPWEWRKPKRESP